MLWRPVLIHIAQSAPFEAPTGPCHIEDVVRETGKAPREEDVVVDRLVDEGRDEPVSS